MTLVFYVRVRIALPSIQARLASLPVLQGLFVLLCWLTIAPSLRGQVQDAFATRGLRGADVLRVQTTLEQTPARSMGVARVTVINPKRPSPADRRLQVVFYSRGEQSGTGAVAYSKSLVLREGQRQATVEVPYVESASQSAWDIGLFEEGRDLEDKRQRPINRMSFNISNNGTTSVSATLAILLAESESEQSAVEEWLRLENARAAASNLNTPVQKFLSVDNASDDWRLYYPYSLWILSIDAIRDCVENRPEVAQAIRSYVATGGAILVHGAELPDLMQVHQFLETEEESTSGWLAISASSNWRMPDETGMALAALSQQVLEQKLAGGEYICKSFQRGAVFVAGRPVADLRPSDLESLSLNNGGRSLTGQSAAEDGNWFWLNLIEAAGKPPVWTFAILVSLFGALLGPGLLFVTARLGRRSLMIFLVPLLSLLATLAIVSYGVLYEGFETHIRVTSLMQVDERASTGFAWSRQNYFSGLPPSEGLTLDHDTYARPVLGEETGRTYYADPRDNIGFRIQLNGQQRWLGWLRPRQQQQLLVGHPVVQPQVPVRVLAAADETVTVSNQSGGRLPLLVLRGADEDYYFAESMAAGQEVELQAVTKDEVKSLVQRGMVDFLPRPPTDMNAGGSLFNFGRRRRSNTSRSRATDFIKVAMDDYLSEKLRMKPYSFATLVEINPQIEMPLDGKHEGDLHIVVGVLQW